MTNILFIYALNRNSCIRSTELYIRQTRGAGAYLLCIFILAEPGISIDRFIYSLRIGGAGVEVLKPT